MTTYAIGDIQGCYDALRNLLDHLKFDPQHDQVWFVGDLVNRGPQSLAVLRFVKNLGPSAITVLGNHDMHLLAISQGNTSHYRDHSLDPILNAPDYADLITWLRYRPLMHYDTVQNYVLIHAGLPPQWDLATAKSRAQEVEGVLRGHGFNELMQDLYGNHPANCTDSLTGIERLRCTINCFTRLRYCAPDGSLGLKEKGPPGTQKSGLKPWFEVPGRATADQRIIFGHWSTLGFNASYNTWAIDTGCLWGGTLTALQLSLDTPTIAAQLPCHQIADYKFYIK